MPFNAGFWLLLRTMERNQLQEGTRATIAAVPGIRGVNNHMGSALADERRWKRCSRSCGETLAALRSELPRARSQGIEIVAASQLLDRRPASP